MSGRRITAARVVARSPRSRRRGGVLLPLLAVLLLLALWEIAARGRAVPRSLVGLPSGIAEQLGQAVLGGRLWRDLMWTLWSAACAFAAGSGVALLFAAAFARWPPVERRFSPLLQALNAMPRIALAPLFVMWFGLGMGSKVALGGSLCLFVVLSHMLAGLRSVSPEHLLLCRSLGASRGTVFFKVVLPGSIPLVAAGLRMGALYAMLGVVGSEIIASDRGMGYRISAHAAMFDVDALMAYLFVLAAVGFGVVRLGERLERRITRAWRA